jgi:TrmH family RNA methyltransferase
VRPLLDGHHRTALIFKLEDIKAVTSRQNSYVESLRDLRDATSGDLLFLEGPKLLEEALKSKFAIERLAFVPALINNGLIQTALGLAKERTQITPYVLEGLSDVKAPQGVLAIVRKPYTDWKRLLAGAPRPIVILDGIQNAGNAATIVRTAEAAGAAGILTTPGSARLFSPKALRGAMGSSLRMPILEHQALADILQNLTEARYGILTSASPQAESRSFMDMDWKKAWGIVLGQEGHGVSSEWTAAHATAVHIPMESSVESLNVAAAAALLLYESRRFR